MNGLTLGRVLNGKPWQELQLKLVEAYNQPGRYYHNLLHIAAMLNFLESQRRQSHRLELELAVWFHDAVYYPTRGDNEESSAAMASVELRNIHVPDDVILTVNKLIMLTKGHGVSKAKEYHEQIFLDADLMVLAQPWPEYLAYAQAIRKEFGSIRFDYYAKGRSEFLKKFLKRKKLYSHIFWAEDAARENMKKEIKILERSIRENSHISWVL